MTAIINLIQFLCNFVNFQNTSFYMNFHSKELQEFWHCRKCETITSSLKYFFSFCILYSHIFLTFSWRPHWKFSSKETVNSTIGTIFFYDDVKMLFFYSKFSWKYEMFKIIITQHFPVVQITFICILSEKCIWNFSFIWL